MNNTDTLPMNVNSTFQIIKCGLNDQDSLPAMRTYVCALLATYIAEGHPLLEDLDITGNVKVTEDTWRALIEETTSINRDEHIYKLVQVCYEMWKLGRDGSSPDLYITAARNALDHKLTFMTENFTPKHIL